MALLLPVGGKAPPKEEGGHWYTRTGQPAYEQRTQKGGLRPTDLRDAKKQGLVPSVTTVLSVIAKPQLVTWCMDQAILAALTLPKRSDEAEAAYLARIREDSKAQTKAAAEEGSRIHDAIECHFKGRPYPEAYRLHVAAVVVELARLFPSVADWRAEDSFAHPMGYGGKVDLHSPSTGIVVDFKGKDGDFSDGKKLAYDQHYQLAAYQMGLLLPSNVCANVFVSRTHPGRVASHVWKASDVDHGARVFLAALHLWKQVKNFDSAFERDQAA